MSDSKFSGDELELYQLTVQLYQVKTKMAAEISYQNVEHNDWIVGSSLGRTNNLQSKYDDLVRQIKPLLEKIDKSRQNVIATAAKNEFLKSS